MQEMLRILEFGNQLTGANQYIGIPDFLSGIL